MMRLRDSASASARRSCSFFNAACCFFFVTGWKPKDGITGSIYSYLLSHCHQCIFQPQKRSFLVRQNHPTTISPFNAQGPWPKPRGYPLAAASGNNPSICLHFFEGILPLAVRVPFLCQTFLTWPGWSNLREPRLLRAIIMHTHMSYVGIMA